MQSERTSPRTFPRSRIVVAGLSVLAGLFVLVWAWRANHTWFALDTMGSYCALDPGEYRKGETLRIGGAVLGVILIGLAWPAGRWASRRSAGAIAAQAGSIGLAVVLALVACDIVLRRMGKGPPPPFVHTDIPKGRFDPDYSWGNTPGATLEWPVEGRTIRYAIDRLGNRASSTDMESDPHRPTILFAGESVTYGMGVQYEEAYPSLVAEHMGVQAVNASVPGFGHDQAYLRMMELLPRFERLLAVVTIILPGQFDRDVMNTRPRLALRGGSLQLVPAWPDWLSNSPLLWMWHDAYHGEEAIDVARAIFRETARAARERGAFPLFVYSGWCLQDAQGQTEIEHAVFDGTDLPHISVVVPHEWIIPENIHPGPRAHQQLADAIERSLRHAGVAVSER